MRAETAAERRVFYAAATWSVPVFAVLVPFVVLGLALQLFVAVGVAAALSLVGGWLVLRHGRGSASGLFVGLVLGSVASLVGGLVILVGFRP